MKRSLNWNILKLALKIKYCTLHCHLLHKYSRKDWRTCWFTDVIIVFENFSTSFRSTICWIIIIFWFLIVLRFLHILGWLWYIFLLYYFFWLLYLWCLFYENEALLFLLLYEFTEIFQQLASSATSNFPQFVHLFMFWLTCKCLFVLLQIKRRVFYVIIYG